MILSKALRAAAGNTSPAAPTDPQFNYVSMLLHGDGTNGAQNNTFIDSSTNNFTITRNGNTTQGSLSPYGNLWSNYFDGNGDYLQTPTSTALNFNSVDYTAEAWVYLNMGTYSSFDQAGRGILSDYLSNSYARWILSVDSGGKLTFAEQNASGQVSVAITDTVNMPLNQWVHTAICKSGTTMYLFKNGVLVGTATSAVRTNFGGRLNVGQVTIDTSYRGYFLGYISNARALKGTALYTSNFTPSTSPLTAITNTALLTCQSNRFVDNSPNNFTITVAGDTRVTKESPFLPTAAYSTSTIGGSGYFDGAGDWLRIDNNTAFDLSTGSWTIEAWIYVTGGTYYRTIISKRATFPSANCDFEFGVSNTNTLYFYRSGAGAFNGSATVPTNTWVHAAITYDGTTFRMFQNGVLVFSQAGLTATYNTYPIGVGNWDGPGNQDFFGYISNLRVVKGTAVYTAAFTPPTAPLTAITNTQLLLNFTNAGIFDNAAKNDLETVGNAQISTSVKKYGTGSLAFDGTGDWLQLAPGLNLEMGGGNFTWEFWIYPNSVASSAHILAQQAQDVTMQFDNTSSDQLIVWDGSKRIIGAVSTAQWTHIALVRSSGTLVVYLNGIATGASWSNTSTTRFTLSSGLVGSRWGGTNNLNGYIDDLRITKGVARYTANFTPPTAAFPNQ